MVLLSLLITHLQSPPTLQVSLHAPQAKDIPSVAGSTTEFAAGRRLPSTLFPSESTPAWIALVIKDHAFLRSQRAADLPNGGNGGEYSN